LAATPGLSVRSAYITPFYWFSFFSHRRRFISGIEILSRSFDRMGFGTAAIFLIRKTFNITPFLSRIDYPDYFKRF